MVVLDTTIVNIALPRIIQVFQANVNNGQLVLTGYMVALAIVMPASGYLADRFGTKRVYLGTIGLFTLGSALCSLAPSLEGLVAFRVLQGLGGGMTMPLGMTILFQVSPPEKRGSIMGIFGLPTLLAPVLGPTLGGYLVQYVDWRFIFTINVPVGILALLLGFAMLRETPRRARGAFDWPGFMLAAAGFTAALLALERTPEDGWLAPNVVTLWLIAAAVIPCWAVVELARDEPLLDLSVFANRNFLLSTVVSGIATVGMFASLLLVPLFLQNVRGLGALDTGLLLFPQSLATGIMMPISGRLVDRIGPRPLAIPGLAVLAYSTWQLAALELTTPDAELRNALILRGIAMGIMIMPVMTVAMDTMPPHLIARATALSNVVRHLVGAFSTSVFATVLFDRQQFHQAILSQTVTDSNPAAIQVLAAVQAAGLREGLSQIEARTRGIAVLAGHVAQAASVLSFQDCFRIAAVATLLGLVPALALRRGYSAQPGAPRPVLD